MAGLLIFIVSAVVASINAIPASLAPYQQSPVPWPWEGGLERFRQAAIGKYNPASLAPYQQPPIEPRGASPPIDPREPGPPIDPREPDPPIEPRGPSPPIEPRFHVVLPKDTIEIKSRRINFKPRDYDCSTDGCQIPFIYGGVTYNSCTNEGWSNFWCATSTDADGNYNGEWKQCQCNAEDLKCSKKVQKAELSLGESVSFASKNYPDKYNKKSKCTWKITGKTEDIKIHITCEAFSLEPSKKSKCKDYLDIDGDKYCGTESPTYTSSKTIVNLKFKSNGKKQDTGFKCTAVAVKDSFTTTPVTPTGSPGTCSCGQANRATRIVGGVETDVNEYPWQVALAWSESSSQAFCGGSIINKNWILTAAHCADVMSSSNVVVAGEHSWSTSSESSATQRVGVEEIVMYPNYDSSTMDNDIALLKLSTPLIFDASNQVAPICPPSPNDLYEDVDAIITGWGTLSSGGSQPDSLQEVMVPTMSNTKCMESYGSWITDNMICAGLSEGGKDSCQGDSGGPMITADGGLYRQIGVVSFGYGCAEANYPGVYARVNNYLDWIGEKTSWCEAGTVVTSGPVKTTPEPAPTGCSANCGRVNSVSRIVGGVEANVNEYPWMVGLAWYASSTSAFCGGSIIDEKYVLTAAHCVAVMDGSEVVVVGEHQWSSSGESSKQIVYIEEIFSHPNYDSSTMKNDVALLKLSSSLTFGSDNKVAPICPPEAGNLYSDINAVVTGWGTTSSGGYVSDTLLEVTVPTMPNSDCQDNYAVYGDAEISDDMICAGLPEGGKDACQGDSGGPMITQDSTFYRQIGVVSWGYGCAYAGLPGVYARVTTQLSWISGQLSQTSGSEWCSPGDAPPPPSGDCKCGRVNRQTRIVNGQETEVLEYPWQAGIVSYGSDRTWCGGSLINGKWVLTAAHCTDGTPPSYIQVLLGEHTIYTTDGTEQRFDVSQVINHPSYDTNPWTNGHDISLLELSSEVDFSSTQIRPICLPSSQDLFENIPATVTGFGRTGATEDQSLVLMEVDIPTVTNDVCSQMYGSEAIDDTMICAGEGVGNGACMGDSGGPLITSIGDYHVQIGVVSFGSSSCNALGVYARVTALQSWIESYAMSGNAEVCTP